jgi:hypothetical protein
VSSPDLIALFVIPLNELDIEYMATGAVAAILYGEPRLTNDIDLVVKLEPADITDLHKAFSSTDFYVPPVEVMQAEADRQEGGHFNLIHIPSAMKADMYPLGNDPLHHWAIGKRHSIEISGRSIWVAPIEYVILRKLEYLKAGGQDKHRNDVAAMLRTSGRTVDREKLSEEIRRLRLEAQWEEVEGSR